MLLHIVPLSKTRLIFYVHILGAVSTTASKECLNWTAERLDLAMLTPTSVDKRHICSTLALPLRREYKLDDKLYWLASISYSHLLGFHSDSSTSSKEEESPHEHKIPCCTHLILLPQQFQTLPAFFARTSQNMLLHPVLVTAVMLCFSMSSLVSAIALPTVPSNADALLVKRSGRTFGENKRLQAQARRTASQM